MSRSTALWNRWLGVGLASGLAVVTLWLAATGRLALYINPSSNWFAIPMAILLLVGAALSFLLPLGAEEDHGHDHGSVPTHSPAHLDGPVPTHNPAHLDGPVHPHPHPAPRTTAGISADTPPTGAIRRRVAEDPRSYARRSRQPAPRQPPPHQPAPRQPAPRRATPGLRPGAAVGLAGGVAASAVTLSILLLPPASLSAELAQSRDVGAAPLFAGADVVALATHGDTAAFGVGDWASVFATATNPDAFEGDAVTLTGFVTPGAGGAFDLTRLVITHCVIDAQPASVAVVAATTAPATGQWVTVTGTVRSTASGGLQIDASDVKPIAEPEDPYEY